MLTRMVTGFVFSLILMLQSVQHYATKTVRLIEPFGAGGGPDLIARALGQKLSESWGQPVTVENHPGAEVQRVPPSSRTRQPTATHCS
jgi:tripartite-type tricarboxylate transporter receptor subunit TctC